MTNQRMRPTARLAAIAVFSTVACSGRADHPGAQATSLLGEPLFDRSAAYGDSIPPADSALAADPEAMDALLHAARARAIAWKYQEAIELYARGIELDEHDWRPYRHRGHRYISTRKFRAAIADLERARDLAPHSWDVAYHLGLAYYLAGRFADAAAEYGRCLDLASDSAALALEASGGLREGFRSCMQNATSLPSKVAMSEWHYRALRRAGHHEDAAQLLASIAPDWDIATNASYYAQLLAYKGEIPLPDVLSADTLGRFETRAYGIANWHLTNGDTAEASALLQQIVRDPHWPGFGRIAAEADLVRLGQ